jgi:N-acyl-L-homoserine lactone synthetase
MIISLTNAERRSHAEVFREMFRARAAVFHDRLNWNVRLRDGEEVDHYDDDEDPVYLVSLDSLGRPTGSLRLLPTTGETMLCNEFASFFDEPVDVRDPLTWECTRFCVHPQSGRFERDLTQRVSSELLIGLCELALSSGIERIVGLYDRAMTRVYRRIGWSPEPLAFARPEVGKLMVGIWQVSNAAVEEMQSRAEQLAALRPGRVAP